MLENSIPAFDKTIPNSGYRWWYIDAVSDCGNYGLVIIAFIGSVFSPYYYRAKQRGSAVARNFCAINVASYGAGVNAWAMTERNAAQLQTTANTMRVGRSQIVAHDDNIDIAIDERTMPWMRRLQGQVQLYSTTASDQVFFLDAAKRHQWQPIAPVSRIEVDLQHPKVRWTGDAYIDTNFGERPLEDDFKHWHWSSVRSANGSRIFYDITETSGRHHGIALSADTDNRVSAISAPQSAALQKSRWGIHRESQHGANTRVIRSLEDAPFYSRSLLAVNDGQGETAMHESLSMDRFRQTWVRTLLPFRMPRITF